jgi:hypothetical protein
MKSLSRIQQKYTFADTVNYRILVVKGSDDSSNQYMNFMNMVFSAEKLVNDYFQYLLC